MIQKRLPPSAVLIAGDPAGIDTDGFACQRGHLRMIVSWGEGWEHVSISTPTRCPTWEEMCRVKGWFWEPEDCVMQLHPPESNYVNCHPYCLHLWRPIEQEIPQPPSEFVGTKASEIP
jgi:hypothetical protein